MYNYFDSIYQYCHDLFQLFNHTALKLQLMGIGIDPFLEVKLNTEIVDKINLLNTRIATL